MDRFEYKCMPLETELFTQGHPTEKVMADLNAAGSEGWDIAGPIEAYGGTTYIILKRKLPPKA